MRFKTHVRLRWIVLVTLVPFVVLAALAIGVWIHGLLRYDSAYFSDALVEQYAAPGMTALALEQALQNDDQQQLATLQGLRSPAAFATAPTMIFVMLLDRTERYTTYLYFDMKSYNRHPFVLEQVDGRWVVSPQDVYYFMRSGQWQRVFWPLAIIWWVLGFIVIAIVWLVRVSDRMRAQLYGGE